MMGTAPHILMIRLSAMGDVAMTVPILLALRHTYPNITITVLTKPFFMPIFRNIPNIQVVAADTKGRHKGLLGLYRLSKELGKLQLDAVADCHNVLRSRVLGGFFRLRGIAVHRLDKGRVEKRKLTAWKIKEITPIKSSHQRYADVFGALGYPIELLRAGELPKQPLPRAMEKSMSETKKWVGIAPFAAFAGKTYPEHLMQRLIAELDALDTYQLFLFGGAGLQRQKLDAWAHRHKNCVSVAGKLDFADELDFISNLGLMLSMDSGNAHLAAMYGVPVVTLWGVTHPFAGFYPFGQEEENALLADRTKYPFIPTSVYGNKMPEGYDTAMETISTKSIVDKIEKLLV